MWDARRGGARTALDYAIQSHCDDRLEDLFTKRGAYYGKSFGKGTDKGKGKGKKK